MKSMTGFGRCEMTEEGVVVALQVSSVNRKNLEVACSLPKSLQHLDRVVQERVRGVAARGRFQFSIEINRDDAASGGLPSDSQIDAAIVRLKQIAERHGSEFVVDSQLLVALSRLLEGEGVDMPEGVVERLLLGAVEKALDQLVAMRAREGAALKADLSVRSDRLAMIVSRVKELAPGMVSQYRESLLVRLGQAGLEFDLEDERVLKEIALFADRCDISEEVTRLESHFSQLSGLLEKGEPVGRPLEFLLQEISREINTTGSKASLIEISKCVMEMKNEMERIREQVANVE